MSKVLFQFRHPGPAPSVDSVCEEYGFERDELDLDFGVIQVDSAESLYTVLVDEKAKDRLEPTLRSDASNQSIGFYANPRIEPFGPPHP